jgi:uncharacterized linocin/CFP29 family protein
VNNLHRELAPISSAAWSEIEDEARRTFRRHVAARRVVDVEGPSGPGLSAVGTGHLTETAETVEGVRTRLRQSLPVIELRVPFTLGRQAVDDVERGARDGDWQPVKDAARLIARAEDRVVFDGHQPAGLTGIRALSDNPRLTLPQQVKDYPDVVSSAVTSLRLAGVDRPYALLLSADAFTAINESSDHGYPIRQHLAKLVDNENILWAPALDGALLVSMRGGDYTLHLGQDLSIGYEAHDAGTVRLFLQETLTFLAHTAEASVVISG